MSDFSIYVSGSQVRVPLEPGLALCTTGTAPGVEWRTIEASTPPTIIMSSAPVYRRAQQIGVDASSQISVAVNGPHGILQVPTFNMTIDGSLVSTPLLEIRHAPRMAVYAVVSMSIGGAKTAGLAGLMPDGRLYMWPGLAKNDAAWEEFAHQNVGVDGFAMNWVVQ